MLNQSRFEKGQIYTRAEIRAATLSGTTQAYLLTKNGRIVAGCFDPKLNPLGPERVYVAPGLIREGSANRLLAQSTAIPSFLKEGAKAYRYVGDYYATAYHIDRESISQAERVIPQRKGDIAGILHLTAASEGTPQ
ncbi:MAG: hypothetical protein ACO1SV_03470 [Fimbriimonas sp.]